MEKVKIARINELARLAKERNLTPGELAERAELRRQYIDDWRAGAVAVLESIRIQEPDGSIHPLEKKYRPRKKRDE